MALRIQTQKSGDVFIFLYWKNVYVLCGPRSMLSWSLIEIKSCWFGSVGVCELA
jgi:hypothetical protein